MMLNTDEGRLFNLGFSNQPAGQINIPPQLQPQQPPVIQSSQHNQIAQPVEQKPNNWERWGAAIQDAGAGLQGHSSNQLMSLYDYYRSKNKSARNEHFMKLERDRQIEAEKQKQIMEQKKLELNRFKTFEHKGQMYRQDTMDPLAQPELMELQSHPAGLSSEKYKDLASTYRSNLFVKDLMAVTPSIDIVKKNLSQKTRAADAAAVTALARAISSGVVTENDFNQLAQGQGGVSGWFDRLWGKVESGTMSNEDRAAIFDVVENINESRSVPVYELQQRYIPQLGDAHNPESVFVSTGLLNQFERESNPYMTTTPQKQKRPDAWSKY